jgi:hypothetical protein
MKIFFEKSPFIPLFQRGTNLFPLFGKEAYGS